MWNKGGQAESAPAKSDTGLEPAPVWDATTAGRGLACYAMVQAPGNRIIKKAKASQGEEFGASFLVVESY